MVTALSPSVLLNSSLPTRLKRYYRTRHPHFSTCSCYHRQPWLASAGRRDLFLRVLEQVRQRVSLIVVVEYVAMPEHIHLLISEPEKADPSKVMQALKQGFARRVLRELRKRWVPAQQELFDNRSEHVWQHRFYHFNVSTARKRIESRATCQSGAAWTRARTGAMEMEQLSKLCLRGTGRGTN
jgi:putative transposase